jgi:hypothetical protein
VDGATFTPDAFTLARQGTPVTTLPITAVNRLAPNKQTWELVVPSNSFMPQTTYAVIVSNRVKDIGGNSCQGDGFTFSTSIKASSLGTAPPTTHTTRPDVFGYSTKWFNPAHDLHNVPASSDMLVRWRGPVDPSTVDTSSVRFYRIVATPPMELSLDSVQVTTYPTATFLITPSQPLAPHTTYAIMVTNRVRDYTGFPVATQDALFGVIPTVGATGKPV